MSPLISARRAAEDFARVVDGIQVDEAERFSSLTATVDRLRTQETPAARAEFVADLRTQLMAAADTLLVPAEKAALTTAGPRTSNVVTLSPATRRHNRRLAIAAAAFVVVGGTAGVAAAAENALPGDPLYPIKRGIESAQVSLNTSDSAKGHDLVSQASTRLDEIDSLMSDGDSTSQITHTLAAYQRSAASGADLLFVSYQRDGDVGDLASLRSMFSDQAAMLKKLAAQAPPTAQPDFAAATALLSDLDQQARVLCGNCGPDSTSSDFVDLTSAPALSSLLTQPAAAAAADQLRSQTKDLANAAGEIAKHTPTGSTDDESTRGGQLPGVAVPSLPSDSPVKSTVGAVTDGVQGLLDDVSSATGGVLTPVTTTVSSTLDALTKLLLGP